MSNQLVSLVKAHVGDFVKVSNDVVITLIEVIIDYLGKKYARDDDVWDILVAFNVVTRSSRQLRNLQHLGSHNIENIIMSAARDLKYLFNPVEWLSGPPGGESSIA